MPNQTTTYHGGCHCGVIRYAITTSKTENPLTPRMCNCTFCQRHGVFGISDPDGKLRVEISDRDAINRYSFGHKTAEFLICKVCGVAPVVLSTIDDQLYSVLNGRTVDQPWPFNLAEVPEMDFEAENREERLIRRKRNWIADVVLKEK